MAKDAQAGRRSLTVVYAYVVGDILHYGHLRHLRNAKSLGDKLVVGILTDEAAMEKKPKPTLSFAERLALVSALDCVDVAIPQETYSPHDNVKAVGADILVESTSHNSELLARGKALMESLGARMIVLPYYHGQSSTKIKERIRNGNKD